MIAFASVSLRTMCARVWWAGWLLLLAGCTTMGPGVVYETPSMFGQLFVTDDGDGLRSMRFGRNGVTQSTMRVGDPDHLQFGYAKLAQAGFALVPVPRRVLVVGLGGGSLPMFLHRHYPTALIDAVEIDPVVVDTAKRYFGFVEDARLRAHVGDGRAFIERAAPGYYDAIMLDAFGSAEVPAHLTTREFLEAVRKALAPGGVVISNIWSRLYNRQYDAMLRTYQEVFAEVRILEASREVNRVVLALPRRAGLTVEQLAARGRLLTRSKGLRFELGELVTQSWVATPPVEREVPVLRDRR